MAAVMARGVSSGVGGDGQWLRESGLAADAEDGARLRGAAVEDLLDGLVDVVERPLAAEDLRQATAVEVEDLLEVVVRADDGAPDAEAAEHRLEDRHL